MKQPKIVFWDLETLPDPREIYDRIPSIGAWPGRTFKAELQSIMSFGYKILGQEAQCVNAWDFPNWENNRHDDSALISFAYEMLSDADEIVTHNGKRFDLKVLNTRLAKFGMPPLPKIRHVDTKVVAARGLSLYSNSLAEVAKFYGLSNKMHWTNKWNTWTRIAFGENSKQDLVIMDKYCKQDVEVLHQIYEKLRPFHGNHGLNWAKFNDAGKLVCPNCGSSHLHKHGTHPTLSKNYPRYRCQRCGATSRTDANDKNIRSIA